MGQVKLTPLTTTIAVRVDGVDLREVGDEAAEVMRGALAAHSVLLFKGQDIGMEEHKAVASVFGQPGPLPAFRFLGREDSAVTIDAEKLMAVDAGASRFDYDPRDEYQAWHVDSSFTERIPAVAVLRSEIISPVGGGTCWSSAGAAFESISPHMQEWLETLTAIHSVPPGYRGAIGLHNHPKEVQERFEQEFANYSHPVVVKHPVSGRKQLFVNPAYSVRINELHPRESRILLNFLFSQVTRADLVYRHRWEPGDIVIWDELATLHLAPDDFLPHPRRVIRVTAGLVKPEPASPLLNDRLGVVA